MEVVQMLISQVLNTLSFLEQVVKTYSSKRKKYCTRTIVTSVFE